MFPAVLIAELLRFQGAVIDETAGTRALVHRANLLTVWS